MNHDQSLLVNKMCPALCALAGAALVAFAALSPSLAEEVAALKWRQTAAFDAPEAHQAAAADERFFYAIANGKIAKYDRGTGKHVATSTGEAQHLNSGFFWKGKLYCAHSNYPRTPERSEIMVLDPESMRLTAYKDFGNFGGSLTWAVMHEDHWWCNFARYGERNAETFLVKFDSEWREASRWSYPPSVIKELGRNSLSGGIWWQDSLLVTGHDDPVLFRLKVPASGKVLTLVEKHAAPFTGQGIASDPLGGLVGIQRSKRKVVFAKLED